MNYQINLKLSIYITTSRTFVDFKERNFYFQNFPSQAALITAIDERDTSGILNRLAANLWKKGIARHSNWKEEPFKFWEFEEDVFLVKFAIWRISWKQ